MPRASIRSKVSRFSGPMAEFVTAEDVTETVAYWEDLIERATNGPREFHDRGLLLRRCVVETAVLARHDAIAERIKTRYVDHVARFEICPVCRTQVGPYWPRPFYCLDHLDEQEAEIDRILEEVVDASP